MSLKHYHVQPGGTVSGTLRVPGDKSISHRSIMLGALAEGVTEVTGLLEGEDVLATINVFRALGVQIDGPENGRISVHGVGMRGLRAPTEALDVGNSGTSARLLCGLLAAQTFASVLQGDASLSKRPMERVAQPLRQMGANIATADGGTPPIAITPVDSLHGMEYNSPVASAQIKSAILLAGLYADGKTTVNEPAISRDHSERMLRGFGYAVEQGELRSSLVGGGKLTAANIDVPADISSAAFFLVAGAIAPNSELVLEHVGVNPTRTGVLTILQQMGADITLLNEREVGGEPVADIRVRSSQLKGIDVDPALVPLAIDEFPVLFVAAACAEGTTRITGAEELKVKESDRIEVMAAGLLTLGAKVTATADGMIIEGKPETPFTEGAIESHDDHRIAMAFTVAALRAQGLVEVRNCANVATSFPSFAELARGAGICLEEKTT